MNLREITSINLYIISYTLINIKNLWYTFENKCYSKTLDTVKIGNFEKDVRFEFVSVIGMAAFGISWEALF